MQEIKVPHARNTKEMIILANVCQKEKKDYEYKQILRELEKTRCLIMFKYKAKVEEHFISCGQSIMGQKSALKQEGLE